MTAILTKHLALGKSCFAPEKAKCKMRLVLVSSGHIMALLMNANTCGGIIPHICMTLSRTQFLFCYHNTELGVQCIGPILQWSKLRFICVNCGVMCGASREMSQRWRSLQTLRVLWRWAGWKGQRMKNKRQLSKCFINFEMTSKKLISQQRCAFLKFENKQNLSNRCPERGSPVPCPRAACHWSP